MRRAKDWEGGFIVGGDNYGQGSSREHAALAPLALGVRCVLAQGFARIHRRNLIAQGLLPLVIDQQAHDRLEVGDELSIHGLREAVEGGADQLEVRVEGKDGFSRRPRPVPARAQGRPGRRRPQPAPGAGGGRRAR